jgi:hypothetical protein
MSSTTPTPSLILGGAFGSVYSALRARRERVGMRPESGDGHGLEVVERCQ